MSINKYTFFSPNGNDFPVTANSDGKLYMMLTGLNYKDLRLKHWSAPLNTALNRVYVNTSLVIGGRYFELRDHSIQLSPAVTNYIHAVIDLSNTTEPITITVEQSNTTNSVDINNASGVLKVCFETITTSGSGITNVTPTTQISAFDTITANNQSISTTYGSLFIGNGVTFSWQKKGDIVAVRWSGTLTTINGGVAFANKAPAQVIPDETKELVGHFAQSINSFHIDLETDGTFRWWGANNSAGAVRGSAMYFIK
ncbi:MAG: hypothetical protein EOM50_18750 [Erysipelotrichia bacterium]|nr:hypothetical protein [Erysipelotrichia bacterium]